MISLLASVSLRNSMHALTSMTWHTFSLSFRGFPSENKKKQVGICYIEVHHQPRPVGTGITGIVDQLHQLLRQCIQCPRTHVATAAIEGSGHAV